MSPPELPPVPREFTRMASDSFAVQAVLTEIQQGIADIELQELLSSEVYTYSTNLLEPIAKGDFRMRDGRIVKKGGGKGRAKGKGKGKGKGKANGKRS